jgi:dephospho-CoA kinase
VTSSPSSVGKRLFVGITGGIGAGKSAFGRALEGLGYTVLSADTIAREITAPAGEALPGIRAAFGDQAFRADGTLDRGFLRGQIAIDPEARRKLEAITHPLIQKRCRVLAEREFSRGAPLVFYEAPLLFEAKSEHGMQAVICVAAADSVRLARVLARDGGTLAQAEALLAAQMPQAEKVKRADIVVWNDGAESALATEAKRVVADLLGRSTP